jgi:hypothetical protein
MQFMELEPGHTSMRYRARFSKSDFSKRKDQLKLFYNIELSQYVLTEMLGALTKGYGISESGVPSSA